MATRGFSWIGMAQYRAALASMPAAMESQLLFAHNAISGIVARRARSAAPGDLKSAIHDGGGSPEMGGIAIGPEPGRAVGTFFGAKGRFGWYAAAKFSGSMGRQFDPWVGDDWSPGEERGKPYFIGDAINDAVDDVLDFYARASDIAAMAAYPIPGATGKVPSRFRSR